MPSFQYQAIHMETRARHNGVFTADSERQTRELLREQNLLTVSIKKIDTKNQRSLSKTNPLGDLIAFFKKAGTSDLITFSRNIGLMVKNGIPLSDALLYFETYLSNASLKSIVTTLRKDIMTGLTFSQAIAKHPWFFPPTYVHVIQAGERSGELENTMEQMTDVMVRSEKLKGKIIATSVYPAVILGITSLVLLIIFVFVLPTFVDIYKQMNVELPMITKIMIFISHILRDGWFISFPALGALGFGLFKWLKSPGGKRFVDTWGLRIPALNTVVLFANATQFVATVKVCFAAGIPITEAVEMAANTVNNGLIREKLEEISPKLQSGQRLGATLANTGYMPNMVLLMVATGEESGDLERMLQNSQDYLDEEIKLKIDILTSLMEPAMLMVLGVIVGFVALSIYMPLFSMYEHM